MTVTSSTTQPFSLLTLSPAFANGPQADPKFTPLDYARLLPREMFWESEEGKMIVSHDGFQLLARFFGVEIDEANVNVVSTNPMMVLGMVRVKGYAPIHDKLDVHYMKAETKTTNYGEASSNNLFTEISKRYPVALAWKRAYDRAVKDHLGLYNIYSEEESDAFRRQAEQANQQAKTTTQGPAASTGHGTTSTKSAPTQTPAQTAKATPPPTKPASPVATGTTTQSAQKLAAQPTLQPTAPATGSATGSASAPAASPTAPAQTPTTPAQATQPATTSQPAAQAPAVTSQATTPKATTAPVQAPAQGSKPPVTKATATKPAGQPATTQDKATTAAPTPAPTPSTPATPKATTPDAPKQATAPVQTAPAAPTKPVSAPFLENPRIAKVIASIPPNMSKPSAAKPTGPFIEVQASGSTQVSSGILGETLEVIWTLASQVGIDKAKSIMTELFPFAKMSPELNNEQGQYVILALLNSLNLSMKKTA